MRFPKDKLAAGLREQVLALAPAMKKLRFENVQDGHYWDEFYHRRSQVRVKIVPFKEPKAWGFYGGFKLKIDRGQHPGRGSNVVLVKIDNLAAVRAAIKESISYIRARKESERVKASFKTTLEKTLPRLFPGRDLNVYSGDHGSFLVSVSRKDHAGAWFDIKVGTDGTVSEVKVSYPGKPLDEVAKTLMEDWK